MAKDFTRKNKRRVRKFNARYATIIDDAIKRMGNNTFAELNAEFDRIREMMAEEIELRGLVL